MYKGGMESRCEMLEITYYLLCQLECSGNCCDGRRLFSSLRVTGKNDNRTLLATVAAGGEGQIQISFIQPPVGSQDIS